MRVQPVPEPEVAPVIAQVDARPEDEGRAETSVGPEASTDPIDLPSTTLPPGDTTDVRQRPDDTRSSPRPDRGPPVSSCPPEREWPAFAGYEIRHLGGAFSSNAHHEGSLPPQLVAV